MNIVGYSSIKQLGNASITIGNTGDTAQYRDWETDRKSTRLNSSH